jgi:hypothetical protein
MKRPPSSDNSFSAEQSPAKKPNPSKTTPQPTPSRSSKTVQIKLPPDTPIVTARYGISAADTSNMVDHIDTFATLLKCVAHVVENCGGSYEEDKRLGSYIIDAVNVLVCCV